MHGRKHRVTTDREETGCNLRARVCLCFYLLQVRLFKMHTTITNTPQTWPQIKGHTQLLCTIIQITYAKYLIQKILHVYKYNVLGIMLVSFYYHSLSCACILMCSCALIYYGSHALSSLMRMVSVEPHDSA